MMADPVRIDYGKASPAGRRWLLLLLIGIGVVLSASALRWHMSRRVRVEYNNMRCAVRLRSLGQAIALYQQDYVRQGSPYPADLQALLVGEELTPDVLVCRQTNDTPHQGATTQQVAGDVDLTGHCSYIYVPGPISLTPSARILVLEDPENHAPEEGAVLFADGRSELVDFTTMVYYLEELDTGRNPPNPEVTLSAGQARRIYDERWRSRIGQLKSGVWRVPATRPASETK